MSSKYNDPKFWVAEKIGFDNWPKPKEPIKNTGDKPVAVVYQTWNTEAYLPYMYHSILSQLMYTDILEKCDIYIFVDDERYEYTEWLFKGLIDSSSIIKVSRMMAVKYMVTCHPILHKYKAVSVCDSDMFFYSETKHNFYQKIEEKFKDSDNILMIQDNLPAKQIFWERYKDLNNKVKAEQYLDFFVENTGIYKESLENWLKTDMWYLSPIFVYNPKTYINPRYYKYAINCAYNEFYCDETVWMVWAKARMIDFKPVDREIDGIDVVLGFMHTELKDYIEHRITNNQGLSLVHPLCGPQRINPVCAELLFKIQKDFKNQF
jgi:hypothetical protein